MDFRDHGDHRIWILCCSGRLRTRVGRIDHRLTIGRLVPGRIRHQEDGQGSTDHQCGCDDPESRLLVIQHTFDTGLDIALTKGERAGRDRTAWHAAVQQRLRVSGDIAFSHIPDDPFIAGHFDIPAK